MNLRVTTITTAVAAVALALVGIDLLAGGPSTSVVTTGPSAVGWVTVNAPSTVEPTTAELDASAVAYRTYLAFATPVPAGATVTAAALTVVPKTTGTGGFVVRPTSSFDPSTLTWNTRPAAGATLLGTSAPVVAGVPVTIALAGLPTAPETDLVLSYSVPGVIARMAPTGISLSVTYSTGGSATPPTTTSTTATSSTTTTSTTMPATTTTTSTTMPATTTTTSTTTTTTTPATPGSGKVMVIMEENHSQSQTYASMPYLAGLASTYGKATRYFGIGHPSLPNYLELWGGSAFGVTNDCGVGCGPTGAADTTVWDQTIAAGGTAKAYQESMVTNCQTSGGAGYVARHSPWPYFTNTTSRANCAAHDVPLTALQSDITAGALPVTGEITPNLTDDWHDGTAAQADAFLKTWVPALMAGPDYTAGRLTIVIVTDEDDGSAANNVAFTVVNPALHGVTVTTTANHYALTRWLEDNAGVAHLGGAAAAVDLRAAFGL